MNIQKIFKLNALLVACLFPLASAQAEQQVTIDMACYAGHFGRNNSYYQPGEPTARPCNGGIILALSNPTTGFISRFIPISCTVPAGGSYCEVTRVETIDDGYTAQSVTGATTAALSQLEVAAKCVYLRGAPQAVAINNGGLNITLSLNHQQICDQQF